MAKLKLLVHSGSKVLSIYKKSDLKVLQLPIFRHFAARSSDAQNTPVFNVFRPQSTRVHEPLENWLQSAFWCILAAVFSLPVKLIATSGTVAAGLASSGHAPEAAGGHAPRAAGLNVPVHHFPDELYVLREIL